MPLPPITEDILLSIALEAGKEIRKDFRKPTATRTKEDGTLLTTADLRSQRVIQRIVADFPTVSLIGEEGDRLAPDCQYILAADPLDGTSGNKRGLAHGTVALAFMEQRENDRWYPISAVIYEPNVQNGWLWLAAEGRPTIEHRKDEGWIANEVRVRLPQAPYDVTVSTWNGVPHNLQTVRDTLESDRQFNNQSFGAIAASAGHIASGWMDATLSGSPSAIEAVSMSLMVRCAGGTVTDLYGYDIDGFELGTLRGKTDFLLPNGILLASSKKLASSLAAIVRSKNDFVF